MFLVFLEWVLISSYIKISKISIWLFFSKLKLNKALIIFFEINVLPYKIKFPKRFCVLWIKCHADLGLSVFFFGFWMWNFTWIDQYLGLSPENNIWYGENIWNISADMVCQILHNHFICLAYWPFSMNFGMIYHTNDHLLPWLRDMNIDVII